MTEYLCEDQVPSPVEEFLCAERELSLLCREAESIEAMRWLIMLDQELQAPPSQTASAKSQTQTGLPILFAQF